MTVFADAIQNVKNINGQDQKNAFVKKITRTATGSVSGLIGGLMIGWYYKKNLYVSGLIGVLAGGAINYYLIESDE